MLFPLGMGYLLSKTMISRNLQPSKIKAFWFLFIKIPHFFCQKHLTNRLKFAAKPIEYILFYRLEGDFYVTCVRHESPPGRSAPVRLVWCKTSKSDLLILFFVFAPFAWIPDFCNKKRHQKSIPGFWCLSLYSRYSFSNDCSWLYTRTKFYCIVGYA